MSIGGPVRDPWEVAKELRETGREFNALKRQAADLQHQSEELDAKAERLRPAFEMRQRELTAAILAPAPHEPRDPPMTATEVLARQRAAGLGRPGDRTLTELHQAAVSVLSSAGPSGQVQMISVSRLEWDELYRAWNEDRVNGGVIPCSFPDRVHLWGVIFIVEDAALDVRDFGARCDSADSPSHLRK